MQWKVILRNLKGSVAPLCKILFVLSLGGVLGLLVIFQTGFYSSHFERLKVRDVLLTRLSQLNTAGYTLLMLNQLQEDLPLSLRVKDADFGASATFDFKKNGDCVLHQVWSFELEPVPTSEEFSSLSPIIKAAADKATSALGGIDFQVTKVSLTDNGRVAVHFQWLFQASKLDEKASKGGIVRDVLIWMGLAPRPKLFWSSTN